MGLLPIALVKAEKALAVQSIPHTRTRQMLLGRYREKVAPDTPVLRTGQSSACGGDIALLLIIHRRHEQSQNQESIQRKNRAFRHPSEQPADCRSPTGNRPPPKHAK